MAQDRSGTAQGSCLYLVDASPYVFRAWHALPGPEELTVGASR